VESRELPHTAVEAGDGNRAVAATYPLGKRTRHRGRVLGALGRRCVAGPGRGRIAASPRL